MPPGTAPRNTAPPRGDARTALLDATLTLVRRQGWAATSIDHVCREVGVTKGAFFHHFATKEALGVAAAQRWTEITAPRFSQAPYHRVADPLQRILAYLDFRATLVQGPPEAFTCFAGTTVQETFAVSEPIRLACGQSIADHAATLLPDFRQLLRDRPSAGPVSAEGLAVYTQTVLQGSFVLAKATGQHAPVLDAIDHLKRYLTLLFPPR